jgi:hypothetical protein
MSFIICVVRKNIIRMITLGLRYAGHVARMEAKLNAYRAFVGKSEKRPLETPGRRWEDNIKVDL